MQMPELSDTLSAATCASTDMIVVNDYTKDSAAAADFAQFMTVGMADECMDCRDVLRDSVRDAGYRGADGVGRV